MGSCRAWVPCERRRENQSVAVGITGAQYATSAPRTNRADGKAANELDLAAAKLSSGLGARRHAQAGPGEGPLLPQRLKSLAQRGVSHPERDFELRLIEPQNQQK